MNAIVSQFRRIYADDGRGDVDFTRQEERLRVARNNLEIATKELIRSSMHLNDVLAANGFFNKEPYH